MIELRVLGPPRVAATDGQPVESLVHQTRRLALLAYLAVARPRGAHRRDKIVALFWPESDESRARAALNQALYVLRTRLGPVFTGTGNDEIALDPAAVWCDVAAFEELLDAGRFEEALAMYGGDLLDGFHIADAPEFERWVDAERQRLRQRAADGAWALAESRAADGHAVEAQRWARRAAEFLPEDEAVVRRLMLFFRGLGDRAAAMRAYEAFAWRLAQEYELEPSPETRALATAIREEHRTVPVPELAATRVRLRERIPIPALRHGWAWPLVIGALVGTAAVSLVLRSSAGEARPAPVWVSLLDVDDAPPLAIGQRGTTIAISTREHIAYVGRAGTGRRLFLKRPHERHFAALPGTEEATTPEFSPDGQWIAFVVGRTIRKVRVDGGPSVEVCRVDGDLRGVSWGDDDVIVFAAPGGLYAVSATGGTPELIASTSDDPHARYAWPDVLPGGLGAVFTIVSDSGYELGMVMMDSRRVRRLGVRGSSPHHIAPDHLLWVQPDNVLVTARFDANSGTLLSPPVVVSGDLHVGMGGLGFVGVSRETLAYVPFRPGNRLVFVDSLGHESPAPTSAVDVDEPRFTSDGRELVLTCRYPESRLAEVCFVDLRTGGMRQATRDSGSYGPVVSATEPMRIAFASKPAGRPDGFAVRWFQRDSAPASKLLLPSEVRQRPRDFTADGRAVIVQRLGADTGFDIWIASLDGSGRVEPFLRGSANERGAALSPDGRWMAWSSDESGQDEIYVGEFPSLHAAVKVSIDGGSEPRWDRKGRALYYRGPRDLMKVDITSWSPLRLGVPRSLFDHTGYVAFGNGPAYDVHPDGNLFAFVRPSDDRGDLFVWRGWLDSVIAATAK